MKGFFPIPDEDDDGIPDFTDNAWAKEAVRRWVRDTVQDWENKVAKAAVHVPPDDTLIT